MRTRAGFSAKRSSAAQSGLAGRRAEAPPLAVVAHGQHQPRIGRGEQLIRHDLQMGVALPRRRFAAAQVRLGHVHLGRHGAIQQGQVDGVAVAGALAGVQTGQHRRRRVQPRQHVRHGHADLVRLAVRRAGDAHQAAQRLDGEVVAGQVGPRPGAAETGDRTDDKSRIDRQQLRRTQPQLGGAGGAEVLQHHVATAGQVVKDLHAFGLGQVEREAALVAVTGEVIGAEFADERRPPGARLVAGAGPLDLQHLGAEVAEHLAAERPGQYPRGVQHAQPRQGAGRVGGHRAPLRVGRAARRQPAVLRSTRQFNTPFNTAG